MMITLRNRKTALAEYTSNKEVARETNFLGD